MTDEIPANILLVAAKGRSIVQTSLKHAYILKFSQFILSFRRHKMYSHIVICTLLAFTGPLLAVGYGEKDETEFDPTYIRGKPNTKTLSGVWNF